MTGKNKIFFLGFVCFGLSFVYGFKLISGQSADLFTEIRISPRVALGERISDQDVFKEIKFLPLETTKESVIGDIDQMETTDSLLIVLCKNAEMINNRWQSKIAIFNKHGKFIGKIDQIRTSLFTLDTLNKQIIVFDNGRSRSLLFYSYTGKLLKKQLRQFDFTDFFVFNNSVAYFRNFEKDPSEKLVKEGTDVSHNNLIILNTGDQLVNKYFAYDTTAISNADALQFGRFFSYSKSNVYFAKPFTYNIYNVNFDKLSEAYQFVFPLENSLPVDFDTNKLYHRKRFDYLKKNPSTIFSINNFYKMQSNLIFKLTSLNFAESFIFNVDDNSLISLSAIEPPKDFSELNLFNNILACDGKSFYSYVDANSIKNKVGKINDPRWSKELELILKSKEKIINPVIIQNFLK
jgi:hypothetical protein